MPFNKYGIFDKIIEGVQIINRDWQYIYVNETVALHGKCTREELIGRTMMEQYPGIENTEMFQFVKDCMNEGTPHQMINEFTFRDDSKGFFELRMQRVDEGVLILSFDVTKQKELEHLLQNTNAILDEKVKQRTAELMTKNYELEQFAYIASHDLREPLRTIANYIQVLEEDHLDQLNANAAKHLNTISSASDRMSTLLNSLLEFSRLGRNKIKEDIDAGKIIAEVKEGLKPMIESSRAKINVGAMPRLKAYESELRQLFQNLISNSIKFCNKNVTPEVEIRCEQQDKNWKFSIRDNGIGIEPKYYERVFQVFQRLHLEYEGHGMGLANCKKIAELHGGKIWIEPAPRQGTIFNFIISKT